VAWLEAILGNNTCEEDRRVKNISNNLITYSTLSTGVVSTVISKVSNLNELIHNLFSISFLISSTDNQHSITFSQI
jgi:hypothetical protein